MLQQTDNNNRKGAKRKTMKVRGGGVTVIGIDKPKKIKETNTGK